MSSRLHHTAALAIIISTTAILRGDCPTRLFDYGPPLPDSEIVQIVLDHYGPDDPIVPAQPDYDRASTDVALIRQTIPFLTSAHTPQWVPNNVLLSVSDPANEDLLCLNNHYAVMMHSSLVVLVFPQPVNVLALIAVYEELPVVHICQCQRAWLRDRPLLMPQLLELHHA